MDAIEMPPITDPLIVAYLRVHNSNAPNPELQEERHALCRRFSELQSACAKHFAKEDEIRSGQLMSERDALTREAKKLLRQIDEVQQANGLRSASQASLQANLHNARERLSEFPSINRLTASLEEIEQNKAEEGKLRDAIEDAKQACLSNEWNLRIALADVQRLNQEYRQLEAQEQAIVRQIEQLKLPPDQRHQPSSVFWRDENGAMFQAMRP
jgi:chromosome segregation ATPase